MPCCLKKSSLSFTLKKKQAQTVYYERDDRLSSDQFTLAGCSSFIKKISLPSEMGILIRSLTPQKAKHQIRRTNGCHPQAAPLEPSRSITPPTQASTIGTAARLLWLRASFRSQAKPEEVLRPKRRNNCCNTLLQTTAETRDSLVKTKEHFLYHSASFHVISYPGLPNTLWVGIPNPQTPVEKAFRVSKYLEFKSFRMNWAFLVTFSWYWLVNDGIFTNGLL